MSRVLILFSGHNDRAVVALCRALTARGLPFALVSSGPEDPILRTQYASRIAMVREDRRVDLALFERIRAALGSRQPVYASTTEFINSFVLDHHASLQAMGWHVPLPPPAVYRQLTSKHDSAAVIQQLCGIGAPPPLEHARADAPCVFKPRHNLAGGQVLYPALCLDSAAVQEARARCPADRWFVQRYIDGQSHYLCAMLAHDGRACAVWQVNLLQQPQGKSIVLARTGHNPGVDAEALLTGLHRLGYAGPLMIEFLQTADGQLHYIETNPRFWGPLQLAVDACPALMDLYLEELGWPAAPVTPAAPPASPAGPPAAAALPHWYAWAKGAAVAGCRRYPALDGWSDSDLQELLARQDVYARDDTRALAGVW
jgi:hypothetical protein